MSNLFQAKDIKVAVLASMLLVVNTYHNRYSLKRGTKKREQEKLPSNNSFTRKHKNNICESLLLQTRNFKYVKLLIFLYLSNSNEAGHRANNKNPELPLRSKH